MRVLIAPDKFAGTLSAVEAADAIADGWRRRAPDDELDLVPMADGGPGFVDVLHASLGGELLAVTVRGPYGEPVPGSACWSHDGTAYVESAQACGLHLTPEAERHAERGDDLRRGQLVAGASDAGATRVVVGLGGSATNDGGAGLLAALGATAVPAGALTGGAAGLGRPRRGRPRRRRGAGRGRRAGGRLRRGQPAARAARRDQRLRPAEGRAPRTGCRPSTRWLERLADATDQKLALAKGAGAAGGLGFALLLLGAHPAARASTSSRRPSGWPSGPARPTW